MNRHRATLFAAACSACLLPAFALAADAPVDSAVSEVTVTAQKRAENSQDVFIDGVFMSRVGMAFTELADIDHIEVLRQRPAPLGSPWEAWLPPRQSRCAGQASGSGRNSRGGAGDGERVAGMNTVLIRHGKSWDGAASTWFWVGPTNDVVFVGMIQVMGGPVRLDLQASSRTLVYQALVEPAK